MFEQYEGIIENYNLEVCNLYKGRGAIIIDTKSGLKLLKEVKLHDEKIRFLYDLKQDLHNKEFLVDKIIKTKEGGLYVRDEDKKYILKEWTNGREIFFNDINEILMATRYMAKLHKCTYGEIKNKRYEKYDRTDTLINTLYRHNAELVRIRNNIRKMPKWSEFDILYLNSFERYYIEAKETVKLISLDYNDVLKKYKTKRVIIHGQYNHHNLILNPMNKLYIVNFEYANYNLPIIDLYSMLRKILEKNDWDKKIGIACIEEYVKVFHLSYKELRLIIYLFMYPEKFWKISNYYFGLNKAWKPTQTLIKLRKLLKQEQKKTEFIRSLSQYIDQFGGH